MPMVAKLTFVDCKACRTMIMLRYACRYFCFVTRRITNFMYFAHPTTFGFENIFLTTYFLRHKIYYITFLCSFYNIKLKTRCYHCRWYIREISTGILVHCITKAVLAVSDLLVLPLQASIPTAWTHIAQVSTNSIIIASWSAFLSAAESKAVQLSIASLGVEVRATHAQAVRIGIRVSGTRPPVAVRALIAQSTIIPVEGPRIYQRQRVAA